MAFAFLLVAVAVFLYWTWRQNELFFISVRDGRVLVVRGRVPAGLLSDIKDVVQRPAVSRASIHARKEDGGARLTVGGAVDEGRKQRLRNVFHLYPISRLRAAPAMKRPTLGQVVGIAWLAWLLDRRS